MHIAVRDQIVAGAGAAVMPDAGIKAFEGCKEKAGNGDRFAQYNLGNSFADGEGVEQDFIQAVKWRRKAIDQGYAVARQY